MSSPLQLWLAGWCAAALVMLALWARQLGTRDATSVDIAWTLNLGALAVFFAVLGPGAALRRGAMALAALVWSARLAAHLLRDRRGSQRGEDGRYAALRKAWGDGAQPRFFVLYQVQALLDALLALPFLLVAFDARAGLGMPQLAGLGLLALAIFGESIADRQLARFRGNSANRGRTCREGFWRYSRHPNYFFEWLNWCAFALLAVGSPRGHWAWIAPLLMWFLVVKVTGIPPNEEQSLRSRGEDYRRYQRTTNAFFPWFPKCDAAELSVARKGSGS